MLLHAVVTRQRVRSKSHISEEMKTRDTNRAVQHRQAWRSPTRKGPAGERLSQGKQAATPTPPRLLSEDEAEAGKPAGDPVPWSPGWRLGRPSEHLSRHPPWKDWGPRMGAAGRRSPVEGPAGAMSSQEARLRHQSSVGWLAVSTWKKTLLSPQEVQV